MRCRLVFFTENGALWQESWPAFPTVPLLSVAHGTHLRALLTRPMERNVLLNIFCALALLACGQSSTNMRAVRVEATVDSLAPSITVQWQPLAGASGYTVYRRAVGAITWGASIASLGASATSYTDASVVPGLGYEYKVQRGGSSTGYGYVRSGIGVPSVETRGYMALIVAAGLDTALEGPIGQLVDDLNGDGWLVLRHDMEMNTTPAEVRGILQADHTATAGGLKAVYLLGRVPVLYSGNHAPDGHSYHSGAWPCDGYYGEMNGVWTDNTVNNAQGNWSWNHNVPGDGKTDQSDFPGAVELAVGRVDLSRLDFYATPENDMLADYLGRAHSWKHAEHTVPATAAVWDNLEWADYPLATSGYLSAVPCVGIDSTTQLNPAQGQFHQHYLANDNLFTYHASTGLQVAVPGGTIFPGTEGGLWDSLLVGSTHGGVFNLSLGSYYGDWDNTDNFLRALIARGNALAHMWSGMPNWYLHPMAMGEPIGYCALRTMNNSNTDYSLQNGGWQGQSMGQAHMALMGDPSLRMRYIAPPTDLVATNMQWYAHFTWQPSPAAVDGYHIYRVDEEAGVISRVNGALITGTTFTSTVPFVPGARYMVRASQLVSTPSGTYHDLSLGALATATGTPIADCAGTVGGSAIPGTPCDDGDPLTFDELYDSTCTCVTAPIGMAENDKASALRVWPTPARDVLNVAVQSPGGQFSVRNANGTEVMQGRLSSATTLVRVEQLPSGPYVLVYHPPGRLAAKVKGFSVLH